MTRPQTIEIPPDHRAAWLQDFRALPPVPRVGWWRRLWGWVSGQRERG